jgi:hypothetical protein
MSTVIASHALDVARRQIRLEAEAVLAVADQLDDSFAAAAQLGRV